MEMITTKSYQEREKMKKSISKEEQMEKTYTPFSIHHIGRETYVADGEGRLHKAERGTIPTKTRIMRGQISLNGKDKLEVVEETDSMGNKNYAIRHWRYDANGKSLFTSANGKDLPKNRVSIPTDKIRELGSLLSGL